MSLKRHDVGHEWGYGPIMSQAIEDDGLVTISGMTAEDRTASIEVQTAQVLAKIDRYLAAAGTDKSKLLSAQLWITDMASFNKMNAVWDAWLAPGEAPARACVEATLAAPQYRVEIMVIAAL